MCRYVAWLGQGNGGCNAKMDFGLFVKGLGMFSGSLEWGGVLGGVLLLGYNGFVLPNVLLRRG